MPRPATLAAAAAESRLPRPPPSRRYLSSVLNGHDGSGSTDSNPLLRRNKLSASNPLLD